MDRGIGNGTRKLIEVRGSGVNGFASADGKAGTLRLDAAACRVSGGSDMTESSSIAPEIDWTGILHDDHVNCRMLALDSTGNDAVTEVGLAATDSCATGVSATPSGDFKSGDTEKMTVTGGETRGSGSTAKKVNLRGTGEVYDPSSSGGAARTDVTCASLGVDPVPGRIHAGLAMYPFAMSRDAGKWTPAIIDRNLPGDDNDSVAWPGCHDQGTPGTFPRYGAATANRLLNV